ncbi:MAG: cation diffusion facilitator family transporter [Planctomycetota bacterium]|nr:cation diffusion facilitator family transporter [Planctomycetota bacterium]
MIQRQQAVSRVLWGTLLANSVVACGQLAYGYSSGVLSVVADGFHSLLDGTSNIIALIGIRVASQPPDADHPYGHQKFEILSAMAISLLLFVASWHIVSDSLGRWNEEGSLDPHPIGYAILLATVVINFLVYRWQRSQGQQLKSPVLLADSDHTLSDMVGTIGALVALFAIRNGWPMVDLIVALIIGLFIARAGYKIALQSAGVLADRAPIDPSTIVEIARNFKGVRDVHGVRSRGFGSGVFVDMNLHVDPSITVDKAHRIAHDVEEKIREELPEIHDVIIHVEPDGTH